MIEYERIDISEGIDINKTNKSKECMLCHYWYFLHKNFSYGPYLCDGWYNIMQKSIDSKNIDIVYVKGNAYRIHFWYMGKHKRKRKRKAISIMTNSNLIDKKKVGPGTRDSGFETHRREPGPLCGTRNQEPSIWDPGPYMWEPGPNTFTQNAGPILRNTYINTTFS